MKSRPPGLRALFGCLAFLGLSAIFGAIMLVPDPTGARLGIPVSTLEFSPFEDFLIPGLILGIVFGIGSFATILALWFQSTWTLGTRLTHLTGEHWSWSAAFLIGAGQMIWIVTQMFMMRGVSVLHFLYGGLGLVIVLLTLEPQLRRYLALDGVRNVSKSY
jgi:hypothetical protein